MGKRISYYLLILALVMGLGLFLTQTRTNSDVQADTSLFVMEEGTTYRSRWIESQCGITYTAKMSKSKPSEFKSNNGTENNAVKLFLIPYEYVTGLGASTVEKFATAKALINSGKYVEGFEEAKRQGAQFWYGIVENVGVVESGENSNEYLLIGGLKGIQTSNMNRRYFGIYYLEGTKDGETIREYAEMPSRTEDTVEVTPTVKAGRTSNSMAYTVTTIGVSGKDAWEIEHINTFLKRSIIDGVKKSITSSEKAEIDEGGIESKEISEIVEVEMNDVTYGDDYFEYRIKGLNLNIAGATNLVNITDKLDVNPLWTFSKNSINAKSVKNLKKGQKGIEVFKTEEEISATVVIGTFNQALNFKISPLAITETSKISVPDYNLDRVKEIGDLKVKATVTYDNADSKWTTNEKSFDFTPTIAGVGFGQYTATVTGSENFSGKISTTFFITQNVYKITKSVIENGDITITNSESVCDEIIKLTYSANSGYYFGNYIVDGTEQLESSFVMPNKDIEVGANFITFTVITPIDDWSTTPSDGISKSKIIKGVNGSVLFKCNAIINSTNDNGHITFNFNHTSADRFLIWNSPRKNSQNTTYYEKNFYYCGAYNNNHVDTSKNYSSVGDKIGVEILFSGKNAYMYVNGVLQTVYEKCPQIISFSVGSANCTINFSDVEVHSTSSSEYISKLSSLTSYEEKTYSVKNLIDVFGYSEIENASGSFLYSSSVKIKSTGNNKGYVSFDFNGDSDNRFLIWDSQNKGVFYYRGKCNNKLSSPSKNYSTAGDEIKINILFSDKHAYMFVNDALQTLFTNCPDIYSLTVGVVNCSVEFKDTQVFSSSSDEYSKTFNFVKAYENTEYTGSELIDEFGTNKIIENASGNFLFKSNVKINSAIANGNVTFNFNNLKENRFIILNGKNSGDFYFGGNYGGIYAEESENYCSAGENGVSLNAEILFTAKNAYLFINGNLQSVFAKIPTITSLSVGTEGCEVELRDVKILASSSNEYKERLNAVDIYEATEYQNSKITDVFGDIKQIENASGNFLFKTNVNIKSTDYKGYILFDFNGSRANRFLIWDSQNKNNFFYRGKYDNNHMKSFNQQDYSSVGDVIAVEILFSGKNAYLFINGTLKLVFTNCPTITSLNVGSVSCTAEFSGMEVLTESSEEYLLKLNSVTEYEETEYESRNVLSV